MGAAGVTAFVMSAPWFLVLGAAGCGLLAYQQADELRSERERALYRLAPPATEGWTAVVRARAISAHRAAQAILDEVAAAPRPTRELYATAADEVRDLYEKSLVLARRLDEVSRYLAGADGARLDRELEQMRLKEKTVADPAAQAQYRRAVASLEQGRVARQELARDAGRLEAQLAAIAAAFEAAVTKVVRVKSAEIRAAAGDGEALAAGLAALGLKVDTLDRAVDEVWLRTREAAPPSRAEKG